MCLFWLDGKQAWIRGLSNPLILFMWPNILFIQIHVSLYFFFLLGTHFEIMSKSPSPSSHGDVDAKERTFSADEEKSPVSTASTNDIQTSTVDEDKLVRKIDLHLMPILFVLYMFAFLDRVNIGNAKIQGLTTELHMSGQQFNVASLILFVPYILLEVPSNLLIKRIRPSMWLGGLMFCWGLITMCQGFVHSYAGLIVCRLLLGVFEAGVFPGQCTILLGIFLPLIVKGAAYLIGMYYKRFELQKRLVLFFSSSMLAGAVGGLLAFALAKLNGRGGYSGWRWYVVFSWFTSSLQPLTFN